MGQSVLIVDADVTRRESIRESFREQGALTRVVGEPFSGMAALSDARFDILCVHAGPNPLSLRGMVQLARRHASMPDIWCYAETDDVSLVSNAFGAEVTVLEWEDDAPRLVAAILGRDPPASPDSGDASFEAATPPFTLPQLPVEDDFEIAPDEPGIDVEFSEEGPASDLRPGTRSERVVVDPAAMELAAGLLETPVAGPVEATPPAVGAEHATASLDEAAAAPPRRGSAVLLEACARGFTGIVSAGRPDRLWQLYFFQGEIAWACSPRGDEDLFERLVASGHLPQDARPTPVSEGQLLSSLVESGAVAATEIEQVMRQMIVEGTLEVAAIECCEAEERATPHLSDTPPPFALNPFGLVLEAQRRGTSPGELLGRARELEFASLRPGDGLAHMAGRVAPFLRGGDIVALVGEGTTLRAFRDAAGLDDMMATQVVLALASIGLLHAASSTESQS
ncbi:MAG: hypothetical protein ACO3JL_17290 [Myxococcota bacterium]